MKRVKNRGLSAPHYHIKHGERRVLCAEVPRVLRRGRVLCAEVPQVLREEGYLCAEVPQALREAYIPLLYTCGTPLGRHIHHMYTLWYTLREAYAPYVLPVVHPGWYIPGLYLPF